MLRFFSGATHFFFLQGIWECFNKHSLLRGQSSENNKASEVLLRISRHSIHALVPCDRVISWLSCTKILINRLHAMIFCQLLSLAWLSAPQKNLLFFIVHFFFLKQVIFWEPVMFWYTWILEYAIEKKASIPFFFWDKDFLLCSSGWPGSHYIDHAGFKFTAILLPLPL